MLLRALLFTATLVCISADESTNAPNQCPQPTVLNPVPTAFYYGDTDNCDIFYSCAHGTANRQTCSNDTRWSNFFQTCAGFNGQYDTCTRDNAQRECARHPGGSLLIPHPTICQGYYNCSDNSFRGQFSFFGQYETECIYPFVFDVIELRCKSFQEAYCGPGRTPGKSPCSYKRNMCGTAHCQPCESRLPSCVGLTDGDHKHPLRPWTPYYITCDTERTTVQTCETHVLTGTTAIFSPVLNRCVSRWEVPRENGGLAPSCSGKLPGQYRTEERSDIYFTCPSSQVSFCGIGFVFNETSRLCERAN